MPPVSRLHKKAACGCEIHRTILISIESNGECCANASYTAIFSSHSMGDDKRSRDSRNRSPTSRSSLPPPRRLPWEGDFSADPHSDPSSLSGSIWWPSSVPPAPFLLWLFDSSRVEEAQPGGLIVEEDGGVRSSDTRSGRGGEEMDIFKESMLRLFEVHRNFSVSHLFARMNTADEFCIHFGITCFWNSSRAW
ncbi:hypothetical protein C4D60_Mb09t06070 [Musa balbisiana]|uniref:Uncharacterized protein n=1 Tax=Musa balbisiana TaxID=52838 RepID=A0A4S8IED9_MUSBA|nr:hypothetical protein C4D60_Mb09t06070 [Musa balbisiana]